MTIYYNEPGDGDYRDKLEISEDWDLENLSELSFIAEECAEDLWDNHDGWESSWPKTIILYGSETGPELGRFTVEMESVPQFSATKKEAPCQAE